jgi:hypothetical protein
VGDPTLSSTIASTAGGVMTDEAGAVTGDLEVRTEHHAGSCDVRVRYAGAGEWYTVTGSPLKLAAEYAPQAPTLHERVVEHLRKPRPLTGGNEEAASLKGAPFS